MYLQKVLRKKPRIKQQDPDPLVRGTDPRIWIQIRTKMSRIRNTGINCLLLPLLLHGSSSPKAKDIFYRPTK
jgi:hypothetical protein